MGDRVPLDSSSFKSITYGLIRVGARDTCVSKNLQYDFPKMRGRVKGQRLVLFQKIILFGKCGWMDTILALYPITNVLPPQ